MKFANTKTARSTLQLQFRRKIYIYKYIYIYNMVYINSRIQLQFLLRNTVFIDCIWSSFFPPVPIKPAKLLALQPAVGPEPMMASPAESSMKLTARTWKEAGPGNCKRKRLFHVSFREGTSWVDPGKTNQTFLPVHRSSVSFSHNPHPLQRWRGKGTWNIKQRPVHLFRFSTISIPKSLEFNHSVDR